jgi:Flp pilus assembly protein TadD
MDNGCHGEGVETEVPCSFWRHPRRLYRVPVTTSPELPGVMPTSPGAPRRVLYFGGCSTTRVVPLTVLCYNPGNRGSRTVSAWRLAIKIAIVALLVLSGSLVPYPRELAEIMWRAAEQRAAGEYAAALAGYRRAASLAPAWELPWQATGEVLLAQGRFADAAAAMRHAEALGAGSEVTLALGESLAGQGDWAGALQVWLRAQALAPGDPRVYLALARGSIAQGSLGQAEGYLGVALSLRPSAAQAAAAHALLGRLLLADDLGVAASYLRQAGDADMLAVLQAAEAEAEPARRDLLLGAAFLQRDELTLARRHLQRSVDHDPGNADALAYLAHCLDLLGENVAAGRLLEQAKDLEPDSALVHYFLGNHHLRLGRLAAAQAALWQALQQDPDNAAFCVKMAEAYARQSDYARAEEWHRAAAEAEPEDPRFQLLLAQFYVEHIYRVEEAGVAAAEAALALAPTNARAQDLLGWAYQLAGRPADAEAALRQALSLDPRLASAHFHLGSLYVRAGDADMARQHLQRAADLDTHGYYRNRAEVLLARVP